MLAAFSCVPLWECPQLKRTVWSKVSPPLPSWRQPPSKAGQWEGAHRGPASLVSIWNNSSVTTALQFAFSICSALLPWSPVGLDPKDFPVNFLYANLHRRVYVWAVHPVTMVPVTGNRHNTCSHRASGLALSSDSTLFLAKDKARTSSPSTWCSL